MMLSQPSPNPPITDRDYRRYLVAVAALLLIGCLAVVAIVSLARTDNFLLAGGGSYQEIITKSKLNNIARHDAEIVIVGDSTGLVGVIPAILERDTGMSAYNLSLTLGSFLAAGPQLLELYLQKNRAPQLIVLYLNPWTTPSRPGDMTSDADKFYQQYPGFEATYTLDNIGGPAALGLYLVRYPEQAVVFAKTAASRVVANAALRSILGQRSKPPPFPVIDKILQDSNGWLSFGRDLANSEHYPSLSTDCSFSDRPVRPDATYLQAFRKQYTTSETRVVVLLAPIPDCDRSLSRLEQSYAGLVDQPPTALASRYFAQDLPRRSHLLDEGAELNTHHVAAVLKSVAAYRRDDFALQLKSKKAPLDQ